MYFQHQPLFSKIYAWNPSFHKVETLFNFFIYIKASIFASTHTHTHTQLTLWRDLTMIPSSSSSHFSTCPRALDVETFSVSGTISPSLLFMWVMSSSSVKTRFAMPSKHFFRWGWTLNSDRNHALTWRGSMNILPLERKFWISCTFYGTGWYMIGQNFMKVHEKLLYHIHHPVPFRYMEIPNFHYYFSTAMSGNATFFIFL